MIEVARPYVMPAPCSTCGHAKALIGRDECAECLKRGHQAADMAAEFASADHGRRADAIGTVIARGEHQR